MKFPFKVGDEVIVNDKYIGKIENIYTNTFTLSVLNKDIKTLGNYTVTSFWKEEKVILATKLHKVLL